VTRRSKLVRLVDALKAHYGRVPPPPTKDAFALVLWEKVAYLANDAARRAAFRALEQRVGLLPRDILAADPNLLREIAALGGKVGIAERAQRMRDAAELVLGDFGGSLDRALALPLRDAKRSLQKIYGIGEPGAEKILLLTRSQQLLPLDSNGARVLCRVGYGAEHRSYTTMYRTVVEAARPELVADYGWLIDAHVLLRHHGQELCKTSQPRCEQCPLTGQCAYFAAWRAPPRANAKQASTASVTAPRSRAPKSPAPRRPRSP
jgi:endonuclease III